MKSNNCPEFIKLEIGSIPPLNWSLEFKRGENGLYQLLAFHHGLGMTTSEAHQGKASEEHVAALNRSLEAIRLQPQSGTMRVICDGNGIEVRTPRDRFRFHTVEEGENGQEFLRCLRLACSQVLDEETYKRWELDDL